MLSALLSGDSVAPTTAEELQSRCPKLWARALAAFQGDAGAARSWLETPSSLFGGEPTLQVPGSAGGGARIARALKRLARTHQQEPSVTTASKGMGKRVKCCTDDRGKANSPHP